MKEVNAPFENAIVATTHESNYLMHKYWARKPANVIKEYIKYFTNENDVVLDPFGGSGVTAIEAAKLNRNAIYNDLSPTAKFIAENTCKNIDIDKFQKLFDELYNKVNQNTEKYFTVKCDKCGNNATITHTIWERDKKTENEQIVLVKTICSHCKSKHERTPRSEDIKTYKLAQKDKITNWYPQTEMLTNGRLLVKEKMRVSDLFNKRALHTLSNIWYEIENLENSPEKDILKFTFTSTIAQASKLVPVYSKKGRENQVGGWTIPGFWLPEKYCEVNALNCFIERFKKIKRGKVISNNNTNNIKWNVESAFKITNINSDSIDYIFTDPPYGDSVPYFEYQIIWASWLKHSLDYENEIIISDSKERNKDIHNYKNLLRLTFQELFRVLKPNGWLTVTFHNSHIQVWNALISSAQEAGFVYGNDCYVLTGRKSSNQLLRKGGSMTGDIYINFQKTIKKQKNIDANLQDVIKQIYKECEKIIIERGGTATTDQLARGILMNLSKHNLFEKVLDLKISDILKDEFVFDNSYNVWHLKENEEARLHEYIPLNTRISAVIDSVLAKKKEHGFVLDEFLVPIFTRYKNGRTPDSKDIKTILEEKAFEKNGKWYPHQKEELFNIDYSTEYEINKDELMKIENEHNSIIYQLAVIGLKLNYQIWIGENEKRKTKELKKISIQDLSIAGISEKAIRDSRINQIDLIWFNPDKGEYLLFEIENSTRMVNCIPRLANLTEKLPHLRVPIYIVIPDSLINKAINSFNDPSNNKLIASDRYLIKYSTLFDNLDLIENKKIDIKNFLGAIAERI